MYKKGYKTSFQIWVFPPGSFSFSEQFIWVGISLADRHSVYTLTFLTEGKAKVHCYNQLANIFGSDP